MSALLRTKPYRLNTRKTCVSTTNAGISNVLKLVLARYEETTLGVLLGLLLGAVVGLWPFQEGHPPEVGDTFKGRVMTADTIAELKPADYPTRFFTPPGGQIASALGLVLVGFAATMGVARLGRD